MIGVWQDDQATELPRAYGSSQPLLLAPSFFSFLVPPPPLSFHPCSPSTRPAHRLRLLWLAQLTDALLQFLSGPISAGKISSGPIDSHPGVGRLPSRATQEASRRGPRRGFGTQVSVWEAAEAGCVFFLLFFFYSSITSS